MIVNLDVTSWEPSLDDKKQQKILEDLETTKLILLPDLAFSLLQNEEDFLTPHCANPKSKNICYDPQTSVLRGTVYTGPERDSLGKMMNRFANHSRLLIDSLLPHYRETLQWGRTSYRPVNVVGRKTSSYRKDDSRLHIDSFAATPVQGRRLLRVFSNINPSLPRVWKLGEPFEAVAKHFLPKVSQKPWISPHLLQKIGITKGLRSPYDHIMLHLHDTMKQDTHYQDTASQQEVSLPAGSTWIVMTDKVSHAALSGQFLLEQTFYLPVESMNWPEHSPLRILERLTGKSLVKGF